MSTLVASNLSLATHFNMRCEGLTFDLPGELLRYVEDNPFFPVYLPKALISQ